MQGAAAANRPALAEPDRSSSSTAAGAPSTRSCGREARSRGSSMASGSPTRHALDAVVCVLAGRNNTALVAAIGRAGGRAVGLTGADACSGGRSGPACSRRFSGEQVDLGLVGQPETADVVAAA